MMPFGIEKNYNVQTEVIQLMAFDFKAGNAPRTRGGTTGESTMLTGDLNIVNVEWIIQYKISDPRAWLFNVENKETTIWDISQSIINMLVGDRGIFHVIGQDRAAIESSCTDLLNAKFKDYNFGIDVTTVRLQSVVAPAGAVQDAFEDVNKAQQDMNRLINEGKEAYNKEIPRARGDAERLIQEAKGYAAERENMATGDVARFNSVYNEYRNNRSVTRTRLYIEMIEDVFKEKENTDLIDKNLKNFVPFKGLQNEGGAR
jgi:membrane protease subunit HflK